MTLPKCLCPNHIQFPNHVCPCGKALAVAVTALEKISIGQNKVRSTGMDTPPISVSRDQLRIWAGNALAEIERMGEGK